MCRSSHKLSGLTGLDHGLEGISVIILMGETFKIVSDRQNKERNYLRRDLRVDSGCIGCGYWDGSQLECGPGPIKPPYWRHKRTARIDPRTSERVRTDSNRVRGAKERKGLIVCIVKMELCRKQKSKKGLMYTKHHYLNRGKQYTTTPASLTVRTLAVIHPGRKKS